MHRIGMEIVRADRTHISEVARLFDLYRQFYECDANINLAKEAGASRIDLLTAFNNKPGQRLYEKLGYKITNETFHSYSLQL